MPKTKTHSGAKKRFKVTAGGKILRRRGNRTTPPGHLVKRKQAKRKRVRQDRPVARSDQKNARKMLGGLKKAEVPLDRKVLAELAVSDPQAFGALAQQAKSALES